MVKTRLAVRLGDEAACRLYRACVELTLERLSMFRRETILWLDPPEALAAAREWLGPGWMVQTQQGTTLGERLAKATVEAFNDGAQRVVVIGTDSPWIRPDNIAEAFAALQETHVTIGPTDDGGYYLVGLSSMAPAIFEQIAWSSQAVYAQTQAAVRALGLTMRVLRQGYDLDYVEDVERFIEEERRCGCACASTEAMRMLLEQRTGLQQMTEKPCVVSDSPVAAAQADHASTATQPPEGTEEGRCLS